MNSMITDAKASRFLLPIYILPFLTFGLLRISRKIKQLFLSIIFNHFQVTDVFSFKIKLLALLFNALIAVLWVKLIEGRDIRTLGLSRRSWGKYSAIGAFSGVISFSAILFVSCAFGIVTYQSGNFSFINIINVFLMIPFWIIQAGTEEIVLRGWVLSDISAKSNCLVGVLISSVLFSVLHFDNAGFNILAFINVFLLGVNFSIITLKTDSIWASTMFHAFWNFIQGSFYGISVSGYPIKPYLMNFSSQNTSFLSGGQFGIEASIITTVFLILIIILFLLIGKTNKNTGSS